MKLYIVVNEDDVVRSSDGYRRSPFDEISLYDLITRFGFDNPNRAEENANYVSSFEKYAPGEEMNSIANDREERMGKRAKENYHVEEITVDFELNRS